MVQAILAASRDFAKNPELWVDAMVKARPDIKREQLETLAKAYAKSWQVDGGLDETELDFTTDAFYKSEDFKDISRAGRAEGLDRPQLHRSRREIIAIIVTSTEPPAISVQDVSKTFRRGKAQQGIKALDGVSLDIRPNSFVSIVGPSGCGKTTLLRMLNGLIRPDEGTVLVDGAAPTPGPHMGFVFQSFRLMPWRTDPLQRRLHP